MLTYSEGPEGTGHCFRSENQDDVPFTFAPYG